MTAYTTHAIDQQSCKDHNGKRIEHEIIKAIKNSSVVKENTGKFQFIFDYDNVAIRQNLLTIFVAILNGTGYPIALFHKKVVSLSATQLSVHHHNSHELSKNKHVETHVTQVHNQYDMVLNHVSETCVKTLDSLLHFHNTAPA